MSAAPAGTGAIDVVETTVADIETGFAGGALTSEDLTRVSRPHRP